MGASDVTVSSAAVNRSVQGMLIQLGGSGIADGFDSVAHALHSLGMWDFIFNQARVTASLHAFSDRDNAIMRKSA